VAEEAKKPRHSSVDMLDAHVADFDFAQYRPGRRPAFLYITTKIIHSRDATPTGCHGWRNEVVSGLPVPTLYPVHDVAIDCRSQFGIQTRPVAHEARPAARLARAQRELTGLAF
jgi:hypothetical protein